MEQKVSIFSFPKIEPSEAKLMIEDLTRLLKKYHIEPILVSGDIHTIPKKEFLNAIKEMK